MEVAGICEALCKNRQKPLLIGSVKASMGHSEATAGKYLINYLTGKTLKTNCSSFLKKIMIYFLFAGFASFVKCVLIARHGTIPPQINFQSPNPNIEGILEGKVKVVDKATTLEGNSIPVTQLPINVLAYI